jgi:uncharacterized protein (UPF0332 family)
MNTEYGECLKKGRIREFSRGKEIAPAELQAAELDLKRAEKTFNDNDFKWTMVQLYYSMFHTARALLYHKNLREHSHYCLIQAIRCLYVEENKLPFFFVEALNEGFNQSEPEFLISCMDRHKDWAVIVCLVGGGQEINTGEAGISEWVRALNKSFPDWRIYISPKLHDSEYGTEELLNEIKKRKNVFYNQELHLAVSMRSFRAENLSLLVKQMLDLREKEAKETYNKLKDKYPIVLTRDLSRAKKWLRLQARGTERYGIVVSSQAQRLKPHAIDVKSPMDPIHWFLDGKEDVRSSYYLEDVATEFHVQGLELDWACVTWDADFRYTDKGWQHMSFCGDRWNNINKAERKMYLKNAYRVLLTRARQGMVIVVPEGDSYDITRKADYYDSTYDYLKGIGLNIL